MKRHNFSGQRATHGVKKVHRHAGGTGCSASPSRLFKGIRMSGPVRQCQDDVAEPRSWFALMPRTICCSFVVLFPAPMVGLSLSAKRTRWVKESWPR